ncbi:MAG: exodeoxyribonuclease III [Desulfobacterales bacterium]|nr:exodeoxyribonuclease III [Desulfobacterales bacterium]MBL7101712.1 exodeoxyribonuclease III [Desulfobacteraceae bacterium]MBL7172906.1 exodeoxyribonuclease III [Desulfobacteraceae bacterium]MBU0990723.1 exodeoxyribonuclease III [Pseudomonadota bacterium]
MKVATLNTNSIRARLPVVLDWLVREAPDILFLQETKVQDRDFPLNPLKDAGYHAAFRGQKSYNGVAILSKSPLDNLQTSLPVLGVDEARFISAGIGDISVINVYVPQGFQAGSEKFQYKLAWLKNLLNHITENFDPASRLLVAGDFNVALTAIDVFDPQGLKGEVGFHPDEQAIFLELLNWGLVDIFRKHVKEDNQYTFWDYRIPNGFKRNMGWRIDYILGTAPLAERSRTAWIDTGARAMEKPSDHTFLVAEFDSEN